MRCYAPDPAGGANSAPQIFWWNFGEREKGRGKGKERAMGKEKGVKDKRGEERRRGQREGEGKG